MSKININACFVVPHHHDHHTPRSPLVVNTPKRRLSSPDADAEALTALNHY